MSRTENGILQGPDQRNDFTKIWSALYWLLAQNFYYTWKYIHWTNFSWKNQCPRLQACANTDSIYLCYDAEKAWKYKKKIWKSFKLVNCSNLSHSNHSKMAKNYYWIITPIWSVTVAIFSTLQCSNVIIFACDIQMKVTIAGMSMLLRNEDISLYKENMTIWIVGLPYFPIVKFLAKWPLKSAI